MIEALEKAFALKSFVVFFLSGRSTPASLKEVTPQFAASLSLPGVITAATSTIRSLGGLRSLRPPLCSSSAN